MSPLIPRHRPRLVRLGIAFLVVVLVSPAWAIDPASLRVSKSPSDVTLAWTDSAAGLYCLGSDAILFPVSPPLFLPVVEQIDGGSAPGPPFSLSFSQPTPTESLVFYSVNDARDGNCGACAVSATVSCDAPISGSTTDPGSQQLNSAYPDCGVTDATGREVAYGFTATADALVAADLTDLTADLSLLVLEDGGAGCDPLATCVGSGVAASWMATAGSSYTLIVEGNQGAAGDFTLTVSCGGVPTCSPEANVACGDTVSSSNDAAGTQLVDAWSGCAGFDASGPEIVYQIDASEDTQVTATLSNLAADLDLYVLEDRGSGCEPSSCVTAADDVAQFDAVAGTTYFLVVDGRAGAVSGFDLDLTCAGGPADCLPRAPLACGLSDANMNDAAGSTDVFDSYAACGVADATGPEQVYPFTPTETQLVTVRLTGAPAGLDLFVLEDQGGGCATAACIGRGDDEVTFSAAGGQGYYLVVDGIADTVGGYTIDVTCAPLPTCDPAESLLCDGVENWGTTFPVVTDTNDLYPCNPGQDYSGPELTYRFTAAQSGSGSVLLETISDLDVFVLEDMGTGCDVQTCIAWGDVTASFDFLAGTTYYIVIDGRAGDEGTYRLELACVVPPSICEAIDTIDCEEVNGGDTSSLSSTQVIDDYPGCGATGLTGPEQAFQFSVDLPTDVEVILGDLSADLDVLVLEEIGDGCDPASCIAFGDNSTTFTAQPRTAYYLVVDGRDGVTSPYRLFVTCSRLPGSCSSVGTIDCGETVSSNNGAPGSTNEIDTYPDCPTCRSCPETGPEITYSFTAAADGMVEARISGMTDDLDVFVLEDTGSGCERSSCVATNNDTAVFSTTAGTTYYIVVEGFAGAVSDFDLTVSCP